LKNGDVLIVMATMIVITAFIAYPFDLVFISALGLINGMYASIVVGTLVNALIVGVVFAGKIRESRWAAIAKITVVWESVWYILSTILGYSPNGTTYAQQSYNGQYGTTLSVSQWITWQVMTVDWYVLMMVALTMVFTIIGLYIGSMLRKPKKT